MKRNILLPSISGLALLAFAGISGPAIASGGSHHSGGEQFAWGHPAPAAQADRTIHIKASDAMRYTPSSITVEKGQTIRFVVENVGQLTHEFVLAPPEAQKAHAAKMKSMMKMGSGHMEGMGNMENMMGMSMQSMHHSSPNALSIPPGETRTLTWTFTRAGRIKFGCHQPGHFAAGMVGTLTVEKS